jgi:hypothetical protein
VGSFGVDRDVRGLASSAPARADQYDFISVLDNSGVSYESIVDMIDIGKAICHDLRSRTAPQVVKPDVVARARLNGYTGSV